MADININVKTSGAESLTSIKKDIKDIRSQALAIGEGGKGFKELTKQANELQDKLDDLKDASKSLQGTGIEKLKSSFGLLTESFQNADFGKAKTAFTGLGAAMKAIPIFLIIEGIQYLVENFEKLSKGSGLLAKALKFVGDIITKLTEGITWLLDKLGLVNGELDKQGESIAKNAEQAKSSLDKQTKAYDQQIAVMKAAGKSTIEVEIQKQNAIIATNKALVEQTIAFVRNGGVLDKQQKEALTSQLESIKQATVDKEVITLSSEKALADKQKVVRDKKKAEKQKEDDDWNALIKSEQDSLNKIIEEGDKEAALAKKKRSDEAIQDLLNNANTLLIVQKNGTDARLNLLKVQYDLDLKAAGDSASKKLLLEAKYNDDVAKVKKEGADKIANDQKIADDKAKAERDKQVKDTIAGVESALASISSIINTISDFNKMKSDEAVKTNQDNLTTQLDALTTSRDKELEKEGLTADQKTAIENKYKQQDYQLKLIAYNKETEIKKKAFEQDKKLKIATTIISTITGSISALTGALASLPYPAGLILGLVSAAAVTAAGAVSVAKINSTKFEAGTPPSAPSLQMPSGGDSTGGSTARAQSGPNLYAIDGDKDTGSGVSGKRMSSNEPIRAYVVTEDITKSQNKNAVIERRSSF